ncbi:MAG: hypothetical protein HYS32_01680 [Candidatus Woesearchaeota archaeon]|nr:MAG: hypothetical protein HYS32_01680 [Candidatus Woesearchaeota archaeon]
MVLLKLYGLLDILAALSLLLLYFDIGKILGVIFSIYLILKSLPFLPDLVSFLDLICGFYIALVVLNFSFFGVTIIAILWLSQKGLVSLFS